MSWQQKEIQYLKIVVSFDGGVSRCLALIGRRLYPVPMGEVNDSSASGVHIDDESKPSGLISCEQGLGGPVREWFEKAAHLQAVGVCFYLF